MRTQVISVEEISNDANILLVMDNSNFILSTAELQKLVSNLKEKYKIKEDQ